MCKQREMIHEESSNRIGDVVIEAPYRELSLRRSEEVTPFVQGVMDGLAALGYCSRDCMGMGLALEEAIVNGLRHGNRGDPTKAVRVRYQITRGHVMADVEDEGPGFDPDLVPDPTLPENLDRLSGRGLFLMKSYTTSLRFSAHGKCVTLYKRRQT